MMFVVFGAWAVIGLMLIIAVVGCYIVEWINAIKNWFTDLAEGFSEWTGDTMSWGFGSMQGRGSYLSRQQKVGRIKIEAWDKMDRLIREIIKYLYCKEMLNNPPLTEYAFEQRMKSLRKLEGMYPELKKKYSPTQYYGFREDMAVEAYGRFKDASWEVIKRTLWLTLAEAGLKDEPKFKLITIPASDDFGV